MNTIKGLLFKVRLLFRYVYTVMHVKLYIMHTCVGYYEGKSERERERKGEKREGVCMCVCVCVCVCVSE